MADAREVLEQAAFASFGGGQGVDDMMADIVRIMVGDQLAALAAAGYAVEWQPIETAPRDRAVLLWDGANMRVAQRLTAMETGETEWVYARQLGEEAIAFIVREPTHWMPLPKPPAAQETRDE